MWYCYHVRVPDASGQKQSQTCWPALVILSVLEFDGICSPGFPRCRGRLHRGLFHECAKLLKRNMGPSAVFPSGARASRPQRYPCWGRTSLWSGHCLVHCRLSSRLPGLYPLAASSIPSYRDNQKCLWSLLAVPWEGTWADLCGRKPLGRAIEIYVAVCLSVCEQRGHNAVTHLQRQLS